MADIETLKTRLAAAESARHTLAIGQSVQAVDYGDRKVSYVPSDIGKLDVYISQLRSEIRKLETGQPVSRRSVVVHG